MRCKTTEQEVVDAWQSRHAIVFWLNHLASDPPSFPLDSQESICALETSNFVRRSCARHKTPMRIARLDSHSCYSATLVRVTASGVHPACLKAISVTSTPVEVQWRSQ